MTPVLKFSLLPPGHKHQIDHGDYKVLLMNVKGEVFAVESRCSHFGLPLENAALHGHSLRCPFHHACFDVRNGKQLESPGMDGIATFAVEIRDGEICLAAAPDPAFAPALSEAGRASAEEGQSHYPYVIVGGGIAAANAVYGIREYDREKPIALITKEDLPPYDRTHVSKALMGGGKEEAKDLVLHSEEFYQKMGVTLLEKTTVEQLHLEQKTIATDSVSLTYDKVLLATGGTPRRLPGAEGHNVYTVRNAHDGHALREMVEDGTKVVIIGGSFIGLETAMSLGKQGADITIVAPEELPLARIFGEEVGAYVKQLHHDAGVTFKLGRKTSKFFDEKGHINTVELDNGEQLPADLVVIGIGVTPATGYINGLAADNDGGIQVDNYLATNVAGAWAAGDIARYPDLEGALRIEHWKVAAQQGRVAGRNMAGAEEPYTMLPFFWSNQQGVNFRYAGHGKDWDQIIYSGKPGEGPFLAFYVKGEHVQAVLGVKRDADTAVIASRMAADEMPAIEQLSTTKWG